MRDPLSHSYYAATALPRPDMVSFAGQHKCDLVIIGGGFTGLSSAYFAAQKGFSVILLEAEEVGFGASGRNGGQLIPGLRWSASEIDTAFGRDRAKAIFDLAWHGVQRVFDLVKENGLECDLKHGHFEAAYKPEHYRHMAEETEFLSREFGWNSIDIVPQADLGRHINGGGYYGGMYERTGGHFHPLNYALGLAGLARAAGAVIYEKSAVISIEDGAAVRVRTADGEILARHAINATDAWMDDVAPDLGRFTVPIMNYNIATAPLPDADMLLPSDAAIADSRFVLNYFRLSADKRMIFGGGEKYMQRPPANIADFVRRHMVDVFPTLSRVPIDYAWGGAVAVTMNRLPHMGRRGNIFFAHGYSGHGALITTLAGELMVEALSGTAGRFDIFGALPNRPFPGGRFLARPLATLGLLWYALRDRL